MSDRRPTVGLTTIVTEGRPGASPGWAPELGEELEALARLKLEDDLAREDLKASTLSILSACLPPHQQSGQLTGLVVGKVQSGKTLSFTGLTAAACDNGFKMVIVLAGTKRILAQQTQERLARDLQINDPSRPWRAYHNPSRTSDLSSVLGMLELWRASASLPGMRKTIVITLHKNPSKLTRLMRLLEHVDKSILGSVLIVDDEADQASLNREVNQGTQSSTYRAVLDLRACLPAHTFLQYTATPQGNLLISLLDLLSPDFAAVLQPGRDYVGGPEMFIENDRVMRVIPPQDIPDPDDPSASPPPSLHRAMRLFFLGLADWAAKGFPTVNSTRNRSMMVHPSRLRNTHDVYARWVRSRMRDWQRILSDETSLDRDAVVSEFRDAYNDLAETIDDMRPVEELVPLLANVMHMTELRIVNSNQTIDIPWIQAYPWLLVGGANLDRGFTVEGLTTTYMPRGPGVGNADTIQQRGRFFGYKSGYLGYCRVFLEGDVGHAFSVYVRHEHSIHDWLARSIEAGVPLRDLPRRFLIDPSLRPTRAAILTDDVRRARFGAEWFRQYTALESVDACMANGDCFDQFVADHSVAFEDDDPLSPPDRRTAHQRHKIAEDIPLSLMYEGLLVNLRIPGAEDKDRWLAAMFLIERWLETHPDATGTLVRMRPTQVATRAVSNGKLDNPFEGPNYDRHRIMVYPGDTQIRSGSATLQLHKLDLYDGGVSAGNLIQEGVAIMALWLDEPLRQDQIVLGQG